GDSYALIRAYDALSGALVWQKQLQRNGAPDDFVGVATGNGQLFAVGASSRTAPLTHDSLVAFYGAFCSAGAKPRLRSLQLPIDGERRDGLVGAEEARLHAAAQVPTPDPAP